MKLSKKSKVLALTLSATMLISAFTFSVSAATVTVPTEIGVTLNGNIVTVNVPYALDTDAQQATILATVGSTADITYGSDPTIPTNIVYIDQETEDGTFSFSFDKSTFATTDVLFIKLGGTDVSTPYTSVGLSIQPDVTILFGDVNGDTFVDTADASLILQKYAGIIQAFPASNGAAAADVNGDTFVDTADASLVLQRYANIITIFPVEQ